MMVDDILIRILYFFQRLESIIVAVVKCGGIRIIQIVPEFFQGLLRKRFFQIKIKLAPRQFFKGGGVRNDDVNHAGGGHSDQFFYAGHRIIRHPVI